MKTFKHILVPTDFERASREALELAIGMARALDAQLTLLHVWEIPIYPYMDFMLNSELISTIEDAATKRLASALVDVQKHVPKARTVLKHGSPWACILDAVNQLEPDLVVMGTHGRHGISHAILGSVAEKVVRSARVPVLTVHAADAVDAVDAG